MKHVLATTLLGATSVLARLCMSQIRKRKHAEFSGDTRNINSHHKSSFLLRGELHPHGTEIGKTDRNAS